MCLLEEGLDVSLLGGLGVPVLAEVVTRDGLVVLRHCEVFFGGVLELFCGGGWCRRGVGKVGAWCVKGEDFEN